MVCVQVRSCELRVGQASRPADRGAASPGKSGGDGRRRLHVRDSRTLLPVPGAGSLGNIPGHGSTSQ